MSSQHTSAALALEQGTPWRDALEALLRGLNREQSEELMMCLNEGRGSFALTLGGTGGKALFIGAPLSGTPVALDSLGYTVCTLAASNKDVKLARGRARNLCGVEAPYVLADQRALPFRDQSFDLVVQEGGPENGWREVIAELARVTRGELVLISDNPLAYKRALGRRGQFQHATPLAFAKRLLRNPRNEARLASLRAMHIAHGLCSPRSFALYPHALEFSHVVGLDGKGPELTIGPRERKNRIKLLAQRAGLFPVFAPSFCVHAARKPGPMRLTRALDALREQSGLVPGEIEYLVATRSNSALALTRGPDPLCLHIPLSPSKRRMTDVHHAFLSHVAKRFPAVPLPRPVFAGELEGTWIQAETRLPGQTAPHLTGTAIAERDLLVNMACLLAKLVVRPAEPLDSATYDRLLGQRCRDVQQRSGLASTAKSLGSMLERGAERLIGKPLPLMFYHADARAKHVQVDSAGHITGLLDWGASEAEFLPFADLGHLLVHQRKQNHGGTIGAAWRALGQSDSRTEGEQRALNRYGEYLDLDEETMSALIELVPLMIAGMAERNWDYSRPIWVHRQFDL